MIYNPQEVLTLCYLRTPQHQTRQLIVLTVEKVGHTMPKLGVLLVIKTAILAKNMAILCSIVKVLKKCQTGGRGGTHWKGNKEQGY